MGGSNVDIESIFQETASTIVGQSWPRGLFRITDLYKYLDYLVTTLPFVFAPYVFIVDEFEVTSVFPLTTFFRDTLDI